jgi:hypothetical protein
MRGHHHDIGKQAHERNRYDLRARGRGVMQHDNPKASEHENESPREAPKPQDDGMDESIGGHSVGEM